MLPLYLFIALVLAFALWYLPKRFFKTVIYWLAPAILFKYIELALMYYYQFYYRGDYIEAARQVILQTNGFPLYSNNFVATRLSVVAEIDKLIYPSPLLQAVQFAKERSCFVINGKIDPHLGVLYKRINLTKQRTPIYYVKGRLVILTHYYLFMKAITKQFSRFFIVGTVSALIQFSILINLVEFIFVKPIWASTFAYIGVSVVNYSLNHYFTFKSNFSHKKSLIRFTLNSIFGIFINFLLMKIFLIYYTYILSQILASSIILFWNFLIHRYWTFGYKNSL